MAAYCALLGQFQPLRRDAPGQRLVALRGANVCAGFDAKFDGAWGKA
jgi:hypothetical protein